MNIRMYHRCVCELFPVGVIMIPTTNKLQCSFFYTVNSADCYSLNCLKNKRSLFCLYCSYSFLLKIKTTISYLILHLQAHLVWPMRCTLPMACSSCAGLRIGSTSSTWVASMMFRPFDPVCNGNSKMLIFSSYLKELKFS